jgi:circadian clock protein KaiC
VRMSELRKTYIAGFDEALGGGIPKGSVVLLLGEPGTMKTSVAYNALCHGAARESLNSLYITLEQSKKSLENQMGTMGFPVEETMGRVAIMDMTSFRKRVSLLTNEYSWLDFLKKCVHRRQEFGKLDLLVIDSLDAIEVLSGFSDSRLVLYHIFEWLRDCDFTSLVIGEEGPEFVFEDYEIVPKKNDAEFLADAIISLKMKTVGDYQVQRRIRCVKMRGQNHDTSFFMLAFESGGFKVAKAIRT